MGEPRVEGMPQKLPQYFYKNVPAPGLTAISPTMAFKCTAVIMITLFLQCNTRNFSSTFLR